MRTAVIIYLSLISISFVTRKMSIVKDLMEELKTLLKNKFNGANPQNLDIYVDINCQQLKTKI